MVMNVFVEDTITILIFIVENLEISPTPSPYSVRDLVLCAKQFSPLVYDSRVIMLFVTASIRQYL